MGRLAHVWAGGADAVGVSFFDSPFVGRRWGDEQFRYGQWHDGLYWSIDASDLFFNAPADWLAGDCGVVVDGGSVGAGFFSCAVAIDVADLNCGPVSRMSTALPLSKKEL